MRFASLALTLALAACGGGSNRSTFARYPGAPVAYDRTAQDAKAVEIADKVLAAAGGAQTWGGAKQVRWDVSVQHDGKEIIGGEEAWDRWNGRHWGKARREGGDIVVMRSLYEDDGKVFMDKEDHLRKIEGGAEDAIKAAKERWEFDTTMLFMPFLLEEPGSKITHVGESQSEDGKPQDVIKIEFDGKDATHTATYFVAVDRETNLPARIEIQKAGKPENERLGYAITGWQDAAGMKVPSAVQNLGMKGEVVSFSNVKVSAPEDDLWTPPPMM
jgi:hypothetical protein